VHNPLGNALVVEVGDFLAKYEVLEQRRASETDLQRALIVGNRDPLVGRQRAVRRIDAHTIEQTHRGVLTDVRPAAADFVGPVAFRDRAGPDNGIGGFDGRPLRRRECRGRVVFRRLVRVERKRGCDVLRARRLLGEDVPRP
jgi:hypothetical protein